MSMLVGTSIGFIVAILMVVDNTDDPSHIMGAIVVLVASIAVSRRIGRWFDERLKSGARQAGGGRRVAKRKRRNWETQPKGEPDITIHYRNYRGEQKKFQAWRASMDIKNNHLVVRVAPEKIVISLSLDRILNPVELGLAEGFLTTGATLEPATTEGKQTKVSRVEYRYRGPEAERCPEHRWFFLVEKDGRHHCPACEKSYTAEDLGWEADAALGYRNHEGEEKVFNALWDSIVPKGNSISVRVMPTFQRITLRRDRLMADKRVRYRNFRGEEKEFEVLASSMRPKGAHFNVWVAPTFQRIALHRNRILGHSDMAVVSATPSRVEITEPEPVIINELKPVVGIETESPVETTESVLETAPATDTVDVVIIGAGISTYDANKAIQDLKPGISYFDVYNLLRDFPQVAFENVPLADAESIKTRLEAAECTIELRPHGS